MAIRKVEHASAFCVDADVEKVDAKERFCDIGDEKVVRERFSGTERESERATAINRYRCAVGGHQSLGWNVSLLVFQRCRNDGELCAGIHEKPAPVPTILHIIAFGFRDGVNRGEAADRN